MPTRRHGSDEYERAAGSGSFDGYKRLILDKLDRLEEQNTRIEQGRNTIELRFAVHEKAVEMRATQIDGHLADVRKDIADQGKVLAKEIESQERAIKSNADEIATLRSYVEKYISADTRKQVAVAASASGALTGIIEIIKLVF